MSATPIPKTMNMAFSGLKDFSFLSTPPPKRLSIKTFLEVSNNAIIKESLNREFNRDGCSFFIENNVEKMERLKTNLTKLVPNQKIGIVHASLNKKTIDKRIDAFRNKEINVLIRGKKFKGIISNDRITNDDLMSVPDDTIQMVINQSGIPCQLAIVRVFEE